MSKTWCQAGADGLLNWKLSDLVTGDTLLEWCQWPVGNNNKYVHCHSPLDTLSQVEQQDQHWISQFHGWQQAQWWWRHEQRHIPHITLRDKTWKSNKTSGRMTWRNVNMAWPCPASADGHLLLLCIPPPTRPGPPTAANLVPDPEPNIVLTSRDVYLVSSHVIVPLELLCCKMFNDNRWGWIKDPLVKSRPSQDCWISHHKIRLSHSRSLYQANIADEEYFIYSVICLEPTQR